MTDPHVLPAHLPVPTDDGEAIVTPSSVKKLLSFCTRIVAMARSQSAAVTTSFIGCTD